MSLSMTTYEPALKILYQDQRVKKMVYERNPFLAMVPKFEGFVGRNYPLPILYANPQGRSATFATGQANKGNDVKVESFDLTRVSNYGFADIDNEVMLASEGDKGAFLSAIKAQVDGIIHTLGRNLAIDLVGDGSGAIGTIASGQTTATVTLTNISDITNFEVGMVLKTGTSKTAAVKAGSVTVSAINRTTGTITCSVATWDNASGIPTVAANDYIFVEGDARNGGSTKKISGIQAWLDPNATSSAFFGVDRTLDITRLAGNYYDGSADTVEEAIIGAGMRLGREGGFPDVVFMNHTHYGELLKELGSKREFEQIDVKDAQVSFKGVTVYTPNGAVTVVADQNFPVGKAAMLQMDTWKLCSLGAAPRVLDQDGLRLLRNSTTDSAEIRVGYYAQLGCMAPGNNCLITLAT